jgi:hypothetical protein
MAYGVSSRESGLNCVAVDYTLHVITGRNGCSRTSYHTAWPGCLVMRAPVRQGPMVRTTQDNIAVTALKLVSLEHMTKIA